MFGDFMGGRGGGRPQRAGGADLRHGVEIELTEAFAGTKATLRVPTRVACEACNGTGSEDKGSAAARDLPDLPAAPARCGRSRASS